MDKPKLPAIEYALIIVAFTVAIATLLHAFGSNI
jgi:Flp pilus assembly pilin Flp